MKHDITFIVAGGIYIQEKIEHPWDVSAKFV